MMCRLLAHRDETDSRLTCLKWGDKRTLVRSTIDANDPEPKFLESRAGLNGLLRFDARALDQLGTLGFAGDEHAEFGGRALRRRAVQIVNPRLDLGSARPVLVSLESYPDR